jgi:hypothetical protein
MRTGHEMPRGSSGRISEVKPTGQPVPVQPARSPDLLRDLARQLGNQAMQQLARSGSLTSLSAGPPLPTSNQAFQRLSARFRAARVAEWAGDSHPIAIQRMVQIHQVKDMVARVTARPATLSAEKAKQYFLENLVLPEMRAAVPNSRAKLKEDAKLKEIWDATLATVRSYQLPDFTDAGTLEELRTYVNSQLRLMKEKVQGQPPRLTLPNVKVGNEFTFTNQALKTFHETFKPTPAPKNRDEWKTKYRLALEAGPYQAAMQQWNAVMTNYHLPGVAGKDKYNYDKLTFRFPSIDWSYDLTVDDACVEVITPATAAKDLEQGEIAEAIDTYIFGVARQAGLATDPTVGSGHINLDRATGIEGGNRSLYVFLKGFLKDAAYWKSLDPDKSNAAFPDELGQTQAAELKKILDACEEKVKREEEVVGADLVRKLVNQVFTKNLAGEPARDSPHYQAVNLEHYDEPAVGQRRIEVRRVPAQESRLVLLNQLDRLFALMEGKKTPSEPRFV